MKLLKGILIFFVAFVFLLLVFLFVFIKTFDINKYLPQITQVISQSIHRPVSVGHANFNFNISRGVILTFRNLRIAGDLKTDPQDLVIIKEVDLQVKILSLFRKQIDIRRVDFKDITLRIEETGSKDIFNIEISHVQAMANNFSLDKPFDFSIDLSMYSKNQMNVELTGHGSLDLSAAKVYLTNIKINSDLAQLDLIKLRKISTLLENLPVWPQTVKGFLNIEIPILNISDKGMEDLRGVLRIDSGFLQFKEILSPMEQFSIIADLDLKNISIKQFNAHIGSGQINATALLEEFLTAAKYNFEIQLQSLKIEDLLEQTAWPIQLKGDIKGGFFGSGESFDPKQMLNYLKSSGDVFLENGRIEKLNILNLISKELDFIPGLSEQISSNLSIDVKNKLSRESIVLNKAQVKLHVENALLSIDDLQIQSDLFLAKAQGVIEASLDSNINTQVYLSQDISSDLVKSIKLFESLLDQDKRIYIPGTLTGRVPMVKYKPQINDIAKRVAIDQGAEQLNRILEKNPKVKNILNAVLGSNENASTDTSNQPQDDPTKKLIGDVLNKILR